MGEYYGDNFSHPGKDLSEVQLAQVVVKALWADVPAAEGRRPAGPGRGGSSRVREKDS
jgi:hypothetical protein